MSPAFKSTPFRRVNPHPGMMIDVDVWRDAHDYHRDQLSLHQLALHGWGVIQGLDVHLVDGADNTVRIEAGMAIDSAGRFVVVPQPQMYQITARERQTVYLVLQFRDVLAEPAGNAPTHVVEAYRIQERDRLPEEPYLELARVDFDPKAGAVKLPRDNASPGKNELDLRSRAQVGSTTGSARPAPPTPTLIAPVDAADGLTPRVDGLSQQLEALVEQVRLLTGDVEQVRHAPAPVVAESHPAAEGQPGPEGQNGSARLESLAAQVQQIAGRVDSLTLQPGIAAPTAAESRLQSLADRVQALAQQIEGLGSTMRDAEPAAAQSAGPTGPSITAEQVSGVVGQQVASVREHVDAVATRVETLAELLTAAGQREAVDVEALGVRVDGVRHEVDALGVQVQALSRQVDALPSVPAPAGGSSQSGAAGAGGQSSYARDSDVTGGPYPAGQSGFGGQSGVAAWSRQAGPGGFSGPATRGVLRLALAEHTAGGWDTHRDGLRFLARELTAATDFDAQATDPIRMVDAFGIEVLYLSGHAALSLGEADVEAIGRLLEQGGAVLGEGCAAGPNGENGAREFAMSFVDLANRLGRQLTRVDRGHPMMRARHIFGELPPGGRATARVLEAGGLVYSDADYGCAWQGGPAERALPRGAIRDALDFGINLTTFRRNAH